MKHYLQRVLTLSALLLTLLPLGAQTPAEWKRLKGDLNLFIANDLGRNGYYQQKPIAEKMGEMADAFGPECIVAAGDVHHFNGIASVEDPLWMTNYELIYSHPELMIDWLPVLGNHEYRGNTQAVIDYARISRRWVMPARYYTRTLSDNGISLRLVCIDTTPLIDKYRTDSLTYPDAHLQPIDPQLAWLDSTLQAAKEDWVIVVGHHPIYAYTPKEESERLDLQKRLLPILQRHPKVSLYVCGHIHNFQHLSHPDDPIAYVVNSSGSLARKVKPTEGTRFCSGDEGFSVVCATATQLCLHMMDGEGRVLHTVVCKK